MGVVTTERIQRLKKVGETLFGCVNPRTNAVEIRDAKNKGDVADLKFSDDRQKSVALDGPFSYSEGGRRAFLVDTVAGLAFQIVRPVAEEAENQAEIDGKTTKAKPVVAYLDGAMLNLIRKDTRIQQIADSNSLNLAQVLKFLVIGVAILVLGMVAALYMIAKLQGR